MSTQRSTVLMVGPDTGAIGGMGSVALTLAQAAERRGDFDVRLLNSGGGSGRSGWAAWPGALAVAAREPYDVMHLHVASKGSTWRKMSFAAIARARRIPYVVHLHGAGYVGFLDSLSESQLQSVSHFFRGAARVVTLGASWRELILQRLGTSADRTVVVGNGVEAIARETEHPTIVHLGELSRRKGVDVLLDVAPTLLARHPEWRLQLVGPAPEPDLVERAQQLNCELDGRIEVLGPKFGDEKVPYLAGAGVFVLASRNEGLPMAMLEAMSAGVPAVVTPVGAIGEVITDGDNGRLVPPGDTAALDTALDELLTDARLREQLGTSGQRTWRERFSSDAMLDGVQETWRAALGEPVSARAGEPASISVIIPTLNRDSLPAAVASALAQGSDRLDVRVIVVNDSDQPLGRDLGQAVTVLDTAGRTGASAARNLGLAAVDTDFFAFLDDDDTQRAGHLQAAVDTLRASGADIYFCRAMVHFATGGQRVEPAELLGARTLRDYLTGPSNWRSRSRRVVTPTVVVRGEHAGHRFDESMNSSEDTWWLLTLEDTGATAVSGDGVFADVHADPTRDRQRRSKAVQPDTLLARIEENDPQLVPGYLIGRQGRAAARAGDPAEVLRVARRARKAGGTLRLAPAVVVELASASVLGATAAVRR